MKATLTFKQADIAAVPENDLFAFTPPEKSVEVQTLNLPGRVAQDFTLKTLDGAKITLSDLRGKVVLLGIDDEDIGTVEGFLKKNEYSLPVLMDVKREVHRMYGARAIPTMIAIDPSGVIQAHYIGGRGEDALVAAVRTAGLK